MSSLEWLGTNSVSGDVAAVRESRCVFMCMCVCVHMCLCVSQHVCVMLCSRAEVCVYMDVWYMCVCVCVCVYARRVFSPHRILFRVVFFLILNGLISSLFGTPEATSEHMNFFPGGI